MKIIFGVFDNLDIELLSHKIFIVDTYGSFDFEEGFAERTKIFLADRRGVLSGARNEDKPSWLQVNFGVLFSNPACDKASDTLILL